jgi:hypothetical protein
LIPETFVQIIPINEAEAILEPFWDSTQSELNQWTIELGASHGLVVSQRWDKVAYEWVRRPDKGPALRMSRCCDVACDDYDRLVLSVMAPEAAVIRLMASTDRGECRTEAKQSGPKKQEIAMDLAGATLLKSVTIEIEAAGDGIAQGWFNWLGLQHSGRLARMLKRHSVWDARWEKHLKDESYEPQFAPAYGLVLNGDELNTLRERHAALTADGSASPFVTAAEAASARAPETMIHDFVNFWSDTRYNRVRDHDSFILNHGLNAAIAGHLLKDKRLLRLAARYALSIGVCKDWDDGFICRFPGSTFEHRSFVQSLCAHEVAGILDLAGECFTDLGRDFLLRRLAEEAIGTIQFNTWKHDYIFKCNQLAWFTPGRMLALGVMQRHWPRVRSYMDIAYAELCENLERSILPDGGYIEGPMYFRCIGRDAGLGVYYYSRALNRPLSELVPEPMRRCGDFGEAVISTDEESDVIPICDAIKAHEIASQAMMGALLPESAWARMLRKTVARSGGWPIGGGGHGSSVPAMVDAAISWGLIERLPAENSAPQPLVSLPMMGPLVSQRKLGGAWVKLFIQGNRANAGHTHEDKGSFILEFAGETFALDPGSCDYSLPLATELTNCERHNMLVPFGVSGRPHPTCPLPADVKPVGKGDAVSFHAELHVTPGWESYYRRWHRTWDSPSADVLTITDYYELTVGEGVEFYWQTRLPVTIDGSRAVISGVRGRVELTAPEGCIWRLDELPLLDGIQHRLAFRHAGTAGSFSVSARLS